MNHFYRRLPHALGTLLIVAAASVPSPSQTASMAQSGQVQQKLAALKASTAENQQKLHQYTWLETARITVNGDAKPPRESQCTYGPDGKVQKVPIGGAPTEAASSGGGGGRRGALRQRIVEKKTTEMKDYMQQVQGVISLYVPPNPQKMQQAFQAKKVSVSRGEGLVDLVFHDYALPGDTMTIGYDTAAKKIRSLHVASYLDNAQDPVSLLVEFSSLPDGANYPLRTTLDASAKKINVVSTNTNYRKVGF